jgi:alpha,alpha-trehalase
MKGGVRLLGSKKTEYARVVELPDGLVLNRYFDNKSTPRPESLREDMDTSKGMNIVDADRLYLNLRAAAESGWDFSTRWFEDNQDLETIRTTELLPIDLNCLLYHLESTIAETYRMILQPVLAKKFQRYANVRLKAINKHLWSDTAKFYFDFDIKKNRVVGQKTLAAVYPLYVKAATNEQASAVAKVIKERFLKKGGLVTTLQETGQQWDSPNGWAPLQWVAIVGLRNYGYHQLADEIKQRWIATNTRVYEREGKLIEKYNVVDPEKLGGGGEYALQDGFGWTNGVLAALIDEE